MTAEDQDIGSFHEPKVRGDTIVARITVEETDGSPKNISSVVSIDWSLYDKWDGTEYISKSLGSGISIVDGSGGVFDVTIDEADTATMDGGEYLHEAQVVDASSNTSTVTRGTVYLSEDSA